MKWRPDLKKETENIICWTGKERKIIWLVCVPAVHGLRTSMSPQFSTTTYCVVLLNQHGNPPQHCHVPCHGGSMEGSRAAQTLTLSWIDRGVLRFFSGVQQQQYIYSYTQTPKPTQSRSSAASDVYKRQLPCCLHGKARDSVVAGCRVGSGAPRSTWWLRTGATSLCASHAPHAHIPTKLSSVVYPSSK